MMMNTERFTILTLASLAFSAEHMANSEVLLIFQILLLINIFSYNVLFILNIFY